jgi:hypothetical protein
MEQGTRITRLKEKAQFFIDNSIKAFVSDQDNNFYFCYIQSYNDISLFVQNFAGKRSGEISEIIWIDVKDIDKYREMGE